VSEDVKAPAFRSESASDDWRQHLFNQERMIEQQRDLLDLQKRVIDAMEKVASPERVRGVEEGQARMVAAVNSLNEEMKTANEQLGAAVTKLASAFWGLMKVPVAVIVVGVASWAFLYEHKIGENTWLIMLGVAVFPWLGDSISAIGKIVRGRNGTETK
jgi:seryl-tRNA synthetase